MRIETPVALSARDGFARDRSGRKLFSLDSIEAESRLLQLTLARRMVAAINAVADLNTITLERLVKEGKTLQLALAWSTSEKINEADFTTNPPGYAPEVS